MKSASKRHAAASASLAMILGSLLVPLGFGSVALGQTVRVDVRVAASSDDAEENASGSVDLSSSDLELVYDSSKQTVGMRFTGVRVPRGSTILSAYVQFQVDEARTSATSLTIQGEATDGHRFVAQAAAPVSFHEKTLEELAIRKRYKVNVVAIRRRVEEEDGRKRDLVISVPMPDSIVKKGDVLLLIGSDDAMESFPTD